MGWNMGQNIRRNKGLNKKGSKRWKRFRTRGTVRVGKKIKIREGLHLFNLQPQELREFRGGLDECKLRMERRP